MSFRSRSTPSPPSQGLVILALAGIFWIITGSIRDGPLTSRAGPAGPPNQCTYQVFRDGICQGTVFTQDPLNLREILHRAGSPYHCPESRATGVIPCDRAVTLHGKPPCFSLETIRGGYLLIARRRIDLNRADYRDLQAVPGIGKHLAEAIITYRETRGPFSSLTELTRITGIGPGKLSTIGRYLRVVQATVPYTSSRKNK